MQRLVRFVGHSLSVILPLLLMAPANADDATVPLTPRTEVRFADVEAGRRALAQRDRYVANMSPWDRQARLKTDRAVAEAEYLKFVAEQVIAWEEADRAKITEALTTVAARLRPWNLPWPKEVLLVQTTGKEEGRAAYCRGSAIVLPRNVVAGRGGDALVRLLLHELFHVLSSHNSKLQQRLYAVVGFTLCGEVRLPPDLAARKITNPDAPTIEHAVEIESGETKRTVVPLLVARGAKYDVAQGGEFFSQMDFRLLVVEPDAQANEKGRFAAALDNGEPLLLDPAAVPSYHDKIGRNTGYIIHPEEVLADNFILLVTGQKDVPTPKILDEMEQILKSELIQGDE